MVACIMEAFLQALAGMKGKNNLILCHDLADSDAIGAAYALARYIQGDIGVPAAVASHAQGLVDALGLTICLHPAVKAYDHVIVVDAAHSAQLLDCVPDQYWLIDHHPGNSLLSKAKGGLFELVSSTSQLVYRILQAAGFFIDRSMALALCAGIMTDTIHFHKGDAEAFRVFGELLACGQLTYEDILKLYLVDDRRDREAIIEAALHAKNITLSGYHILVSEVSLHIPTFAARALFDLGADVSIVGCRQDGDVDVRMYIRQELSGECGLHAAQVFRHVARMRKGKVFGYQQFAGYRGRGPLSAVLDLTVQALQQQLSSH